MPVTLPTWGWGVTRETRAKTEPLAVPRPAAISSRQTVAVGTRTGSKDWRIAKTATRPSAHAVTTAGWTRSASQPPKGRKTTVTRAKPAARVPASVGLRPYQVRR